MGQFLLLVAGALVVGAIVFGVAVLITGDDPGLGSEEPDGRSVPLPAARPLVEHDIGGLRFDTALRGYRMAQVDAALRRAAYDLGYKEELIDVLQAEVTALREGRVEEADALRRSREGALGAGLPDDARPAGPAIELDDDDIADRSDDRVSERVGDRTEDRAGEPGSVGAAEDEPDAGGATPADPSTGRPATGVR